jgi:hypothetical protein
MSTEKSAEVQHKGHEIVDGDEKHPAGKKQRRSGLGKNYGQGVGYGGYSVEQGSGEKPDRHSRSCKGGRRQRLT